MNCRCGLWTAPAFFVRTHFLNIMQKCIKKALTLIQKSITIWKNKDNTNLHYKKEIRKWKRRLEVFMKLNLVK